MATRDEAFPLEQEYLAPTISAAHVRVGVKQKKFIRLFLSYIVLAFGGCIMLMPVLWMLTAALKPEWQISAPTILLPSYWHKAQSGSTSRLVNLWQMQDGSEVVLSGARQQYVTVLATVDLPAIIPIPKAQIKNVDIVIAERKRYNTVRWQNQTYIVVGADGESLLAVLQNGAVTSRASMVPKTVVRGGETKPVTIGGYSLNAYQIAVDGKDGTYVEVGPSIDLSIVLPAQTVQFSQLVPSSDLGNAALLPLANSQIEQYTLRAGTARYLVLEQVDWQPVINPDILSAHAFTIAYTDFKAAGTPGIFSQARFPIGTAPDPSGRPVQVAVMQYDQLEGKALVLPVEYAQQAQLITLASLLEPEIRTISGSVVKVKDLTSVKIDEQIDLKQYSQQLAVVGERQTMSLIIPADKITVLHDVFSDSLQRKLSVRFQFQNFFVALFRESFGTTFVTYFKNSTIISGLSILGHLFSCTVVAYAFARMRAPGKNFWFAILISTMMMPGFITVIPTYAIFRDLHMIDTLWPMFIRSFFGNAFLIFLLRQFFASIPFDLDDAARVDGANRIQTFRYVMLPLITPALATVLIFTFLWSWNNTFDAAIYLNSPQNYTVALGLRLFMTAHNTEFNLMMAAATIVMLPTVALFFVAQRFFVEGITLTGIKG